MIYKMKQTQHGKGKILLKGDQTREKEEIQQDTDREGILLGGNESGATLPSSSNGCGQTVQGFRPFSYDADGWLIDPDITRNTRRRHRQREINPYQDFDYSNATAVAREQLRLGFIDARGERNAADAQEHYTLYHVEQPSSLDVHITRLAWSVTLGFTAACYRRALAEHDDLGQDADLAEESVGQQFGLQIEKGGPCIEAAGTLEDAAHEGLTGQVAQHLESAATLAASAPPGLGAGCDGGISSGAVTCGGGDPPSGNADGRGGCSVGAVGASDAAAAAAAAFAGDDGVLARDAELWAPGVCLPPRQILVQNTFVFDSSDTDDDPSDQSSRGGNQRLPICEKSTMLETCERRDYNGLQTCERNHGAGAEFQDPPPNIFTEKTLAISACLGADLLRSGILSH